MLAPESRRRCLQHGLGYFLKVRQNARIDRIVLGNVSLAHCRPVLLQCSIYQFHPARKYQRTLNNSTYTMLIHRSSIPFSIRRMSCQPFEQLFVGPTGRCMRTDQFGGSMSELQQQNGKRSKRPVHLNWLRSQLIGGHRNQAGNGA